MCWQSSTNKVKAQSALTTTIIRERRVKDFLKGFKLKDMFLQLSFPTPI